MYSNKLGNISLVFLTLTLGVGCNSDSQEKSQGPAGSSSGSSSSDSNKKKNGDQSEEKSQPAPSTETTQSKKSDPEKSQEEDKKDDQDLAKEFPYKAPFRNTGGEFTKATDLYGPLVVEVGDWLIESDIQPWSASWYPYAEDTLFKDDDSPLRKYDAYFAKKTGTPGKAAEAEKKLNYRPQGSPWAGRCHSWSLASVLEKDPKLASPALLDGISFTTKDLRALLIMTYDNVGGIDGGPGLIQFGHRNNGDSSATKDDIYPEEFHKVVQKELHEKRLPFIMDKDPGIEVWNVPVSKAAITIVKDENDPFIFHVTTFIMATQPMFSSAPGALAWKISKILLEYTYDLYGYPKSDGKMEVVFGLWTGDSVQTHPDFLWAVPAKSALTRESKNPALDVEIVDEIILRSLSQVN